MILFEVIKDLGEKIDDKDFEWPSEECRQEHEQLLGWLKELKDLRLENEVILRRLKHLLESEYISQFDQVHPSTKEYILDIKEADIAIDNALKVKPQKIVTIPPEIIEKLAACVVNIVGNIDWEKAIEAYKARSHDWIPVKERLPEGKIDPKTNDFESVLCTTIWGDVRTFKFGKPTGRNKAHFWSGGGVMDNYVIAWMPKPEPYKEAENE